ncbi:MAG: AAA family ATPase [Crocinitomicaceae bacterium]
MIENDELNPESNQANENEKKNIGAVPNQNTSINSDDNLLSSRLNLGLVTEKVITAKSQIGQFIIGQHELVDLLLISLFSRGHVLLEGVPGIAKTLTAKVLSKTLSVDFSRLQFTPDLMPSDVIGTSIFNLQKSTFEFKKGPIFSNIVLIDEINRAPAKTQAALFEVMEERQISYDGEVYKMDFPFLVLATQNPVEQEGTYNLPEAQLDRFLFKVKIGYPSQTDEFEILKRYKNQNSGAKLEDITSIFDIKNLKEIQNVVEQIKIEDQILNYISLITEKTRHHAKIYLGGSPRASLSMLRGAKAFAAIRGRDFVIPDDVQYVCKHVLNHRIILTPEAEMEGLLTEDVISEILQEVEVPR